MPAEPGWLVDDLYKDAVMSLRLSRNFAVSRASAQMGLCAGPAFAF
jgi:hypothetical protein